MLLSGPLASLITFSRTNLIKVYHNSQRMPDHLYHKTESSELNWRIRVPNIFIWPCKVSRVLEFLQYVPYFDLWRHEILSHTCVSQENS